MICAFEEGLSEATRSGSRTEIAALWLDVLREVFTVALPMQLRSTTVVASAVSLVGTSALFLVLLWALDDKAHAHRIIRHWTLTMGGN
jgi:hypothetical protein